MKRIAIVYDWFDSWGGVERILLMFSKIYPHADFYTSFYDRNRAKWAKNLRVYTSFLQYTPNFMKRMKFSLLPLFPYAFESFDFSDYDVVISVTSSFAKGIITRPHTKHICYLLTPTRYFWGMTDDYVPSGFAKLFIAPFLAGWRKWDYIAAQRPDTIISISKTVAARCKKYYRRDSEVIYPAFDEEQWKRIYNLEFRIQNSKSKCRNITKEFYLIVSRLEPYKKIDLAIKVFNKRKETLVIVGKGTELQTLKKLAGNTIVFLQDVSDENLAWLYSNAKAYIMPQEEDFGYASIEAQFFGCPVVAFGKGGALETVLEGKTGLFFEHQTETSLHNALERLEAAFYNDKHTIQTTAQKHRALFLPSQFEKKFLQLTADNPV